MEKECVNRDIRFTFGATKAELFDFRFEVLQRVVTSKGDSPSERQVANETLEHFGRRRRSGDFSLVAILDFQGMFLRNFTLQGLVNHCQVGEQRGMFGKRPIADATFVETCIKLFRFVTI